MVSPRRASNPPEQAPPGAAGRPAPGGRTSCVVRRGSVVARTIATRQIAIRMPRSATMRRRVKPRNGRVSVPDTGLLSGLVSRIRDRPYSGWSAAPSLGATLTFGRRRRSVSSRPNCVDEVPRTPLIDEDVSMMCASPAAAGPLPLTSLTTLAPERLHAPPRPLRVQPARRPRPDHRAGRRGGRSRAWIRWRSPTTARCTAPSPSTRRRRPRASSRSSASRRTSPAAR